MVNVFFMSLPPEKFSDPFGRSNILDALGELFPLKPVLILLATAVAVVLGYYFTLFAIHGFDVDFLEINRCVESGGRWNDKLRICEKQPGIYSPVSENEPPAF